MILEMDRVQIWGMKKYLEQVIPILHNFGKMQLDDIRNVPDAMVQPFSLTEELQSEREEVDILIASINGLIELFSSLVKTEAQAPLTKDDDVLGIKNKVADVTAQVQYLNNRKKTIQDELISLSKYNEMLNVIAPVMPQSSKKSGNASIRALVHTSQMRAMNMLSQQLKLMTRGKFEMISVRVGESTNAIIGIFPLEMISQVENFMKNEKVTQLILPEEYAYLNTDEALQHISKKVELDHQELDEIDGRLERIAGQWLPRLRTWQLVCKDRVDEFEAYTKLGETEYTFTLFGWIPAENVAELKEIFLKRFNKDVTLNVVDIPNELRETIPVATQNPAAIEPFENFVTMRAVPKYTDIDPGMLVAFFMPLFFGMMVGDVGYGILMLAISLWLSKKNIKGLFGDFFKALKWGSLWSILFGVLYGEYFGNLGESLGIKPLWFSRGDAANFTTLLIMALAVGVAHIVLGLLIGIWNAAIHKSRNNFLERAGTLVGLAGLFLLGYSLLQKLPDTYTVAGWITLAVGLIAMGLSMGGTGVIMAPIEFVGVIGNILSYLRIAALGLASVFLAMVANDMAGMVGSAIAGVVIAVLIHSLNLVMGMLSPTIQSLRLQYVEFFRKFYEGGQSSFSPFKKRINVSFTPSNFKEMKKE
ncbi:MAG: V/A-type H+/Na+-transporting ATPase subunit [Chloroflexota bacterium]|nr:V/A-type H+/Na+-transporting ATPase subunit [Chloroflexota bacterium]